MKFYGKVQGGQRNKGLDFGSNLDHHADCPIRSLAITQQIMIKFSGKPHNGTRNNWLIFWFVQITMLTPQTGNLGNMEVMSCLDQGGLRSLSALVIV